VEGEWTKVDTIHGNWERLPPTVLELGDRPEEIFAGYYQLEAKLGKEEIQKIPFGAIAMWTLADKLAAGLQQLLAGARKFSVREIARDDLMAANRETAAETGIPFVADAQNEAALQILDS
ncbi:MAG TPA: hypothetical protein PLQ00_14830, partial [Thermoguttaceae bacterium]|nr:hypothetical protein [Thermoguttaceae bacterium]